MNGSVEAKGLKDLVGGLRVVGGVLMVGCVGVARGVVRGILR